MGKGGEKNAAAADKMEKKEVLIDGVYYDVTNMKHPGGTVIDFYAGKGIDATQAFGQFHIRTSTRVQKFMKALPNRPADPKEEEKKMLKGQTQLLRDFEEFTKQLEKEGYFKPSIPHAIYRITEIVVLFVAGVYLLKMNYLLPGIILMALGQGRSGWLMHEGGHYSLFGVAWFDKLIQELVYGIGCGMSGGWWRSQHNRHHSMPQKLGYDVDLNTLPLVAFTSKVVKKAGSMMKGWISLQAILFPVITTSLVATGWQFFLHPRHIMRKKLGVEALALIIRYALWTYFITAQFGVAQSALIYIAFNWFSANYIFINFAVSHTHLDVVPKEDTQTDWVRYAAIYTMNIKPGPFKFVNWWMGYLNFQIEHHLFPCMPQFRHPTISPRVKKFFEDHGFKYDQRDYFDAMRVTFANLHKVGNDVFLG